MALPDHFEGEDVIITLEKEGSASISNVDGKVLNWNISGGSQPTEDVFAFGNKTFNIQKPREKFQVEFEVMINNTDFDFVQFGSYKSADTLTTTNKLIMSDQATSRWRVIFWFQDAANHVKDGTVVVPAKNVSLYRMICVDVKSVTFDKEFAADEYMKGTLTLEFSSTDESGNPNFIEQEGIYPSNGTTTTGHWGTGTTSTALASMTTTATDVASNVGLLIKSRGFLDWVATAAAPSWTAGTASTKYRKTS